jgi:hypothetical protein
MYSASHSVSAPINGMGGELVDGSGTINPAALNSAGMSYLVRRSRAWICALVFFAPSAGIHHGYAN